MLSSLGMTEKSNEKNEDAKLVARSSLGYLGNQKDVTLTLMIGSGRILNVSPILCLLLSHTIFYNYAM